MGKTRFSERFRERIPEFTRNRNWFDVAAFACQDLMDVLEDHGIKESEFCNQYLKKGHGKNNPNLFTLGLPYDAEIAWDEEEREEDDFSVIHDIAHILEICEGRTVKEDLRKELEAAAAMLEAKEDQMEKFLQKPELTKEALAYALICGVDLFLFHGESGQQKRKRSGPLNRLASEKVQLYKLIFSLFQPNLVLVPAWSGSIEGGFKEGFRDISVAGAVSVLGNCCEAVTFMLTQKGKNASVRPQSGFRVFTGIPVRDDNNRIARVRCPHFSQEPCPHENCMITYDITIRKDGEKREIFAVEDPVLIRKDGEEERLSLWKQ